jgi:hypothetical protein
MSYSKPKKSLFFVDRIFDKVQNKIMTFTFRAIPFKFEGTFESTFVPEIFSEECLSQVYSVIDEVCMHQTLCCYQTAQNGDLFPRVVPAYGVVEGFDNLKAACFFCKGCSCGVGVLKIDSTDYYYRSKWGTKLDKVDYTSMVVEYRCWFSFLDCVNSWVGFDINSIDKDLLNSLSLRDFTPLKLEAAKNYISGSDSVADYRSLCQRLLSLDTTIPRKDIEEHKFTDYQVQEYSNFVYSHVHNFDHCLKYATKHDKFPDIAKNALSKILEVRKERVTEGGKYPEKFNLTHSEHVLFTEYDLIGDSHFEYESQMMKGDLIGDMTEIKHTKFIYNEYGERVEDEDYNKSGASLKDKSEI